MNYFILLVVFLLVPLTACQAKPKRELASAAETNIWIEKFKVAQTLLDSKDKKACQEFQAIEKIKAPTPELKMVSDLKQMQACKRNDFHLARIDSEWLVKDAVIFGLRNTQNPDTFLKYYKRFQKLDANAKSELEFLERAGLFKNILKKSRKDSATYKELLDLFPSFYVTYKLPVPEDSQFEAAYGLRMQRQFQEARNIYDNILAKSKNKLGKNRKANMQILEKIEKAYEFKRITYRVEEKKPLGIAESKKGLQFFKNFIVKNNHNEYHDLYVKIGVQLARDIWTEGNKEEARSLLHSIEKFSSGKTPLDQLYWVLGRIKQDEEKYQEAVDYFKKGLAEVKARDFKLKLMWLVAWNQRKANQLDEAIASLEDMKDFAAKSQDDQNQKYKAIFWTAKLHVLKNEKDKAKKLFKKIADEYPFGYYGRVSLLESEPKYWEQKVSTDKVTHEDDDVVALNVKILSQMDQLALASEYIQNMWLKQKSSWRRSLKNKTYLLSLNEKAGLLKENQQYIEIFDPDDKEVLLKNNANLMFPTPHLDVVENYGKKLGVPKELVYSIMRQESLFDPKARSPADAFGLLQLIPRVAKQSEKRAGVTYNTPQDLYNPEVIIPLGIAQLSILLGQFDDSKMLTAASYNAGYSPAKRWQKQKYNADPFEFIEDIPYAETETYVKLVFRNLSFYVLLNKEMKGSERIDFLRSYFKLPQLTNLAASTTNAD